MFNYREHMYANGSVTLFMLSHGDRVCPVCHYVVAVAEGINCQGCRVGTHASCSTAEWLSNGALLVVCKRCRRTD